MGENIELDLEPCWKYTSEVWVDCSKCGFIFLMPLVALKGKKPDNLKIFKNIKSFFGKTTKLLMPKYIREFIFAFMMPYSKFCKKCRAVYVSKIDTSIKLKEKYWEVIDGDSVFGILDYLDEHTIDFNVFEEEKCECGSSLIIISTSCPICNNELTMSRMDNNGLPIVRVGTIRSGTS